MARAAVDYFGHCFVVLLLSLLLHSVRFVGAKLMSLFIVSSCPSRGSSVYQDGPVPLVEVARFFSIPHLSAYLLQLESSGHELSVRDSFLQARLVSFRLQANNFEKGEKL